MKIINLVFLATFISTTAASNIGLSEDEFTSYKVHLAERMQDIVPLITDCYTEVFNQNPSVHGMVIVEFLINNDGRVENLSFHPDKTTLRNSYILDCIADAFKTLQANPPKTQDAIFLSQEFDFRSNENNEFDPSIPPTESEQKKIYSHE